MKNTASATVLLLTAIIAGHSATRAADVFVGPAPVFVIWHDGSRNVSGGLELAVWEDETMLLAPRRERPGTHLLVAKCMPGDVQTMLAAIRAAKFAQLDRDWVVPDTSATTISVRIDSRLHRRAWHENLTPGFGGDINKDPDYRAFVGSWKRVRGAIESLPPTEVARLCDHAEVQSFRGFDLKDPRRTSWVRESQATP